MTTFSIPTACPLCGQSAVITLFEQIDPVSGTEGHRIEFGCIDANHQLDEPAMLRLWAVERRSVS